LDHAISTDVVDITGTLGTLKARKALETRETTKLLQLHLLLGLLLKTEHGREAILLRLLLHALKSGHAIHLHALKAGQLLLKAAHGTGRSLEQHRELLLLDLLLKQGLLLPLGLGNESQLVLLLLRVEAISATTCLGLGLSLLEESGESVESNRWLVFRGNVAYNKASTCILVRMIGKRYCRRVLFLCMAAGGPLKN
jgi:hypothetical protein